MKTVLRAVLAFAFVVLLFCLVAVMAGHVLGLEWSNEGRALALILAIGLGLVSAFVAVTFAVMEESR